MKRFPRLRTHGFHRPDSRFPLRRNGGVFTPENSLVRALVLDYREHEQTFIRCSTVHQFQGSESDVVFFDAVESYPAKKPGWLMGKDFNSIKRLINVAVTRAKGKLVCVANEKFWKNTFEGTSHTLYRLLGYLNQEGNVIREPDHKGLSDLVERLSIKGGPEFYSDPAAYVSILEKDIKHAKRKIVIALPSGKLNPQYENVFSKWLSEAQMNGVQILIKTNDYVNLPDFWKKKAWGTENAVFPLVMIDDRVTWYGVPSAPWVFVDGHTSYNTICPIAVRIKGEHTAEIIRSLTDLEYKEINGIKTALIPKSSLESGKDNSPGLASYIAKVKKCTVCNKPLVMTKGKSGKTILWCKDCQKTYLLTPDMINHYMLINHISCPKCKAEMTAKVGPYGIYIRCDHGHNIKPEEI